jgi:hypothetical protein
MNKIGASALLALAAFVAPNPSPAGAPQSAKGGPSADDTSRFIADYLLGCGEFSSKPFDLSNVPNSIKDSQGRAGTAKQEFKWQEVSIANGVLTATLMSRWLNDRSSADFRIKYEGVNTKQTIRVPLSSLSPTTGVSVDQDGGYASITLKCAMGACIDQEVLRMGAKGKSPGDTTSSEEAEYFSRMDELIDVGNPHRKDRPNGWSFAVCGGEDQANRVAKALNHAITLAGGKKPLF